MAILGKVGAVCMGDLENETVFSDEATTPDVVRKRFQITDPDYRYWNPDKPVTVKVDGEVMTSGFELEHLSGYVVFDAPVAEDVSVSGFAIKVTQVGGFFNWSLDLDADYLDKTTFDTEKQVKHFAQGSISWSGSAEAYWGNSGFFDILQKRIILQLFVDSGPSLSRFEGPALINSIGVETPSDELVTQTIEWVAAGPLYVRL